MRIKILLMAVVLTGLLFSLSASAVIITPPCGEVPVQQTKYDKSAQIDKFDQSLGQLQSVHLTVQPCGYLSYALESTDESTIDFNINAAGNVVATLPIVGNKAFDIGTDPGGVDFTAVPDGILDWAGTDYTKILIGSESSPVCEPISEYDFTGADMALFIGNAGDKLTIPVSATSSSLVTGSANYRADAHTFMGVKICVEYEYLVPLSLCINGTKTNECTGDGIPGWQICLTKPDGTQTCTMTDSNGDYSFCGLAPGAYTVREETRAGWTSLDSISRDITLVDVDKDGVDFTNAPLGCISGTKFNSKTNTGLSGWTINLKKNGAVINTTTTGTGGSYEFCGLAPGSYTVCEVLKSGWTAVSPTCIDVVLGACVNSEDNDFSNQPVNQVCVCPFFIKNELYTANCNAIKEVDASKGILANDPPGSIVLNPESIKIDPKYGTISVEQDGSFVYDPTGATGLTNGVYVIFKYSANNGQCDSKYLGIAKIQVSCK